MEKISASKLLAGLVPAGKLTSDPEVELVTTDSREVKPGCIFVAFPGERFDGHDFAARALEQGAEYVVVNHPVPGVPEEKAILCPDSYHAMMVMGANYRSQYHPKMVGVTVIEDCYNANPDSMKAALAMFKDFPCKRRFALLGDMLELGELSREAHEELGRLAAESGLYCLITYGEQAKRTAVEAAAKGVETLHADSYREAADALLSRVQPGDAVLVKASHGMALEKVLDIFYEEHKEAEV